MNRHYIYRAYLFGLTWRSWRHSTRTGALRRVPRMVRRWATVREGEPLPLPGRQQ